MVCIYTPHGVRNSTWYPGQTGPGYTMSPTLEALTPLRNHVSVLTGLCHPRMASNVGHAAAGRWLTGINAGARILVDFASPNQSLSVDQVAANSIGMKTRWPSLQGEIARLLRAQRHLAFALSLCTAYHTAHNPRLTSHHGTEDM